MKYTKFFLPFLSLFFLVLFIQPVGGLGFSGSDIGPSTSDVDATSFGNWFIYEVDRGDVIEDRVRISNNQKVPLTFTIDAVDAITLNGGGFGLLDKASDNKNLGSWVELETNEITVGAGESKVVNFTITIPEDAEVGDHIGGLVMMSTSDEPDSVLKQGGSTINIRTRVGSRMYLTVLGDIVRDFKILSRSFLGRSKEIIFKFKVHNLGNIRTELKADIKIYGIFGLFDELEAVQIGQIFPREKVDKKLVWQGKERPLFGPYLALIKIYDAYEPMTHANSKSFIPPAPASVTTWAFTFFIPYTQMLVLLILLFVAWFIRQFFVWRSMVTLTRQPVISHKIKKSDHLMGIAEEYGIGWKLLAKLNNIKPPHSLHDIKEIYIPDSRGSKRDVKITGFWKHISKPFAGLLSKLKNVRKQSWYTIVVDKGDTTKDIETHTGMKWAKIAKYNHLNKTFKLKANIELKVPRKRPKQ